MDICSDSQKNVFTLQALLSKCKLMEKEIFLGPTWHCNYTVGASVNDRNSINIIIIGNDDECK